MDVDDKQRNFDLISNLPDSLLCQILSYLSTKESVSTSILSKRWRNLWSEIPVLDLNLDFSEFPNDDVIMSFLNRFLDPDNEQHLDKFELIYDNYDHHDDSRFRSWINAVINPRICHLHFVDCREWADGDSIHMPMSIYSCERLVNLNLRYVALDHPQSISLPSLKILYLVMIEWEADSTLKTLISSCPALEELTMISNFVYSFCVRSRSLKSLKLESYKDAHHDNIVVEIDAPRLEYMSIIGYQPEAFVVHRIRPSSKINIDFISNTLDLDDSSNITMINKFFTGISTVSDLTVSSKTLQVIRDYCEMGMLPQFSNLSRLEAYFKGTLWEMLPSFLESFPNLKSVVLDIFYLPKTEEIDLSYVPQCFISSLEFVHLKVPYNVYQGEERSLTRKSNKVKLAKYFLHNCPSLKKLTLCKSFHDIISEIKLIPSSTMCEVVREE